MLAGCDKGRRIVIAADAAAERLGLEAGMAVTKARALVPQLRVADADAMGDARALVRLALWALRYSPVVTSDPPDGLVIDTTGAEHLHGGESAMLADMVARLAAAGIEARAAVADTWGAAHAAARFLARPTAVVPAQAAERALRPLPVDALRLSAETIRDLRALGFERIGDIVERPRGPLTLRFGPDLLRRLDQALGRAAEPIEPVHPPALVTARRAFAEPISAPETIARYTVKLVAVLCAGLEERGLGARQLDLLLRRVDNTCQAIRIGTAQPVRDAGRLTRLLCERIETVDPGFGIEAMQLAATRTEPLAARQVAASLTEEAESDIASLIDVLANRIGAHRVYRFAPVASDVPERSVARVPPLAPATGESWTGEWPRPPQLLPKPEPIDTLALLPDHPPVWFVWHGVRRRIARADGPERVFGEWWKRDAERAAVRDYFRVEDEAGERYWIFRTGDGEDPATGAHSWFLHGIFA